MAIVGKVGDYKVGLQLSTRLSVDIIDDEEEVEVAYRESPEGPEQTISSGDTTAMYSITDINRILSDIHRDFGSYSSFDEMATNMSAYFVSGIVVIFKYGQKIPLSRIKRNLFRIILDAKIPLEIAFAAQFSLVDHFVAAKAIPSYQHYKKEVDMALWPNRGAKRRTFATFCESITTIAKILEKLIPHLRDSEIRLELYFLVNNENDLNEGVVAVKKLLKDFILCKKRTNEVETIFKQQILVLKHLYSMCHQFEDDRIFLFLSYYSPYIQLIHSTLRLIEGFRKTNFGCFLKEIWIEPQSKTLIRHYFTDSTVVDNWYILLRIFGTNDNARPQATYYYFQYYLKFRQYIESDEQMLIKVAQQISEVIFTKDQCKDISNYPNRTSVLSIDMIRILCNKHPRSVYYGELLKEMYHQLATNSRLIEYIGEILIGAGFRTVATGIAHFVARTMSNQNGDISWQKVISFAKSLSFYDYQIMKVNNRITRLSQYQPIMRTAEVICKASHYYLAKSETVFRQFQFDLTDDLLMKIPTKLNSTILTWWMQLL